MQVWHVRIFIHLGESVNVSNTKSSSEDQHLVSGINALQVFSNIVDANLLDQHVLLLASIHRRVHIMAY